MAELQEYEVRVKDREQDCTHTVHYVAASKNEANSYALAELQLLLGHDNLEVV